MLAIRCRTLRPTRTDPTIGTLRHRQRRSCLMLANKQAACSPDGAYQHIRLLKDSVTRTNLRLIGSFTEETQRTDWG